MKKFVELMSSRIELGSLGRMGLAGGCRMFFFDHLAAAHSFITSMLGDNSWSWNSPAFFGKKHKNKKHSKVIDCGGDICYDGWCKWDGWSPLSQKLTSCNWLYTWQIKEKWIHFNTSFQCLSLQWVLEG